MVQPEIIRDPAGKWLGEFHRIAASADCGGDADRRVAAPLRLKLLIHYDGQPILQPILAWTRAPA